MEAMNENRIIKMIKTHSKKHIKMKNKKGIIISIIAVVRLVIALAVLFLVVFPACNKLKGYIFSEQVVVGLLNPVEDGECVTESFNEDHKAVDILVDCGNPVKAACSGLLSGSRAIFGGASTGDTMGLQIDHLENCKDEDNDWSEYVIKYGCVDFVGREEDSFASRDVKQGDIIGTVGRCDAEANIGIDGCHVHFVLRKPTSGLPEYVSACEYLRDVETS